MCLFIRNSLLIFMGLCLSIFSYADSHPKKIAIITIPKSGSHLLTKAIMMMTGIAHVGHSRKTFNFDWYKQIQSDYVLHAHIFPAFDPIKTDPESIKIVGIRDLRDVCISAKHFLETDYWYPNFCNHSVFFRSNEHDRISYMIKFPGQNQHFSIKEFAHRALEWMKVPDVYVCRFENLVGPMGGGSRELQIKTLTELAKHIQVDLSPEQIDSIADNLWGSSKTFRKGKKSNWKEVFSPIHKELAKQYLGDELIDMGYEKDKNW